MLFKKPKTAFFVLLVFLNAIASAGAVKQDTIKPSLWAGPPRLQVEFKSVLTLMAWSPDGKQIATGTADGSIYIADAVTGKQTHSFYTAGPIGAIAFAPDAKTIAVLENLRIFGISVWNISTGKKEKKVRIDVAAVKPDHLAYTPDGQAIMGAGAGWTYLWTDVGEELNRSGAGDPGITAVAIAPDGSSAGWHSTDGKCTFVVNSPANPAFRSTELQVGNASSIAFGLQARLLAVGGEDRGVQLWDMAAMKKTAKLTGLEKPAIQMTFSADGQTIAALSGDGKTIRVWDLQRQTTRCQIRQNVGVVGLMALSPDGKMLSTLAKDGKVLNVWTTSARQLSRKGPPLNLSTQELAREWGDLANSDCEKAVAAWHKLGAAGDSAIEFLRNQIRAIAARPTDMKRVEELVGKLNAEKYATREQATKELEAIGESAIVPLQRLLEKPPSQEARQRASLILKQLAEPIVTPDRQRVLQAIDLLEQLRTDKAVALLAEIKRDALIPQVRDDARRALQRLGRL